MFPIGNITVAQLEWECFLRTADAIECVCVSQGTDRKHVSKHSRASKGKSVTLEDEDWNWAANKKTAFNSGSNLTRSGSVKDLIYRFDGSHTPLTRALGSLKVKGQDVSRRDTGKMRHESKERGKPVSSGEIPDPRLQESSEQKLPITEKKEEEDRIKHAEDGEHNTKEQKSPDAPVPGPVSPGSDPIARSRQSLCFTANHINLSIILHSPHINLSIICLISSCTLHQSTLILINATHSS